MILKEKCVYYNPIQEGYYLVTYIDDEMIYGRRGDCIRTSNLEDWINQDGPGVVFKIDDITICRDYIRNYYLDEKCLEQFELVRELTDDEFYPIYILIASRYKYPTVVIDVCKHTKDASELVKTLQQKRFEKKKIEEDICNLEKQLFVLMRR